MPTPAPDGKAPGEELYTESDELRILLLSLAGVFVVLAGVLLRRALRR